MNRKQRRALIAAGAMIGVLLLFSFATRETAPPPPPTDVTTPAEVEQPLVKVVVAKVKISKQSRIRAEMIGVEEIPKDLKHPNAATDPAEVLDRFAVVQIFAKEQLLLQRLGESSSADVGLAYVISRGKRAVSIPMTTDRAVGGYISPGKYVDVVGSFKSKSGLITRRILEKVKILAINDNKVVAKKGSASAPPPAEGEAARAEGFEVIDAVSSVTFELNAVDAEKLILASQNTTLHLEIVHPDAAPDIVEIIDEDEAKFAMPPVQQGAGTPGTPQGPQQVPQPSQFTVQVIRHREKLNESVTVYPETSAVIEAYTATGSARVP